MASMGATLLALASIGLVVPTLFHALYRFDHPLTEAERHTVASLSQEIAIVLAVIYCLSVVFSLQTHRHVFAGPDHQLPVTGEHRQPEWGRQRSLIVLVLATIGVAAMSELLVGSVGEAAHALGWNEVFVGVVVVAVVGNAAEHSTAVLMALKDKMDLAFTIAVGSSIQIALFVAPVLVGVSMLMGDGRPLDLHFSSLEVVAVLASLGVLSLVSQDGESHWMEGAMLLAVYFIFALAFYHFPTRS
jgi:Ca2+:H+ antiporter